MQPSTLFEWTLTDRLLIALHPAWAWLGRRMPGTFGPPEHPEPHPSAMLAEPNSVWRRIFPRFFARISVEEAEVERLRATAAGATIVYVTKYIGQLEYNFFNHLFASRRLPLARYSNALTMRRWMPFRISWRSIATEEQEIGELGRPRDPLADGALAPMVAAGDSVLLNIPTSDLEDESLLFTGPLRGLLALFEAQRASSRPIVLVPLDFLWSRRPKATNKSLADILFGEKESPGHIRKFTLFWRNYKRRAQASIGAPIDLAAFLRENEGASDEELAHRMRARLAEALRAQRRTITGPPIRPRSWFIQEVMADEALDSAICRLAAERGEQADDLRELALRYIREIASDLDSTWVELAERVLGSALIRLFESFDIDVEGLTRAKALFEKGPIVFVPSHRSHVDYLILSYIFYHHGMTVPFIAAGRNLGFWPLGAIFRRCGAFFIRRSFRDNILYRDVLATYLKVLLREGHCQEFFIEGGRSRTGKLAYPKMGMLRMLLAAAREGGVSNVMFVPVSITYDRVIEHRSYVRELEGARKEKEKPQHLIGLTRYMRRQRLRYGSIHIRFGEPIPATGAGEEPGQVEALAFRICHEINRRTVATPAAVAAAALLCVGRAGITETEFSRNAEAILAVLRSKGVEIPPLLAADPQGVLREAVAQMAAQKLVTARTDALEPFIAVEEERRVPLACFRNVIAHALVTVGVVARLIAWHARQGTNPTIEDLSRDLERCQHLLHHEFRFATRQAIEEHVARAVDQLASLGSVNRFEGNRIAPRAEAAWVLDVFGAQVRPFVETLWVATRFASERITTAIEERALIEELMRAGLDMYLLGRVRFRESVTREGFANALHALLRYNVLLPEPQKPGTRRRNAFLPTQDPQAALTLKVELEKLL